MSGVRYLYISKDLEVTKIPIPKDTTYKAVPKLASQLVLQVVLIYETYNRKPERLLEVCFDRIQLDVEGKYELTQEEIIRGARNYALFGFQTPKSLSESNEPTPIPTTITIPTKLEKRALLVYIKEKLPKRYVNWAYEIEKLIQSRIETNNKNLRLVKEASRLKRNNKK